MHDMTKQIDGESLRYNSNKIMYSNVPPSIMKALDEHGTWPIIGLTALAEHYTLAAIKYPDAKVGNASFPNWAKGQLFESFVIDSMLRHFIAYEYGEQFDPEFGSHHLIAVAWGAAALHHFFTHYELYKSFDDRKWVGFEIEGKNTFHNLFLSIQTTRDTQKAIDSSYSIFYNALVLFEVKGETNILNQKIGQERLDRIKAMKFDSPNKSNNKTGDKQ